MSTIFKATRPLEYVCLFQMDFPTKLDGDVFAFLAVDAYSQKLFNTGMEKDRSNATIIKHTKLLLQDQHFKNGLARNKSFTLVFHKFEDILTELNTIVKPYNGNCIISDAYVTEIFKPVMINLLQSMNKNIK
jgi:hypothetical protein